MSQSWSLEAPQRIELDGPVRSVKLNAVACSFNIIGTKPGAIKNGSSSTAEPTDSAESAESAESAQPTQDARPGSAGSVLEVTKVSGPPLEVTLDDGHLVIRHRALGQPNMFGWLFGHHRMEVELTLAVPADCATRVNIVSGSVAASSLRRDVTIRTVSGDVTLAGLSGGTRAETVSGTITAEQVVGDLRVNAVSGSITVIAAAGRAVDLSAVSGTIALDLENPMPRSVKVNCVSGSITARLPHKPDVTVDVRAANGRATSAFPELSVERVHNSQHLAGSLGSGAARLSGHVMSGAVTLLRRDADDDEPADFMPGGFAPNNPPNSPRNDPQDGPRDAAPGTDHPEDAF